VPVSAVFDTNILFSGLGWQGRPFQCLQAARRGELTLLTCREILTELEEKLWVKRNMPAADAARAVAEILSFSQLVAIPNVLKAVAADPDDDKILECAIVGGARYIVTGDRRHLLPLGNYQGIPIITAAAFLTLISAP
jgi:putative PIN family toxin of toxin-antitoxin system